MKNFLLSFIVTATTIFASVAQTRTDSNGAEVFQPLFFVAEYQLGDFDIAKQSSSYGVGLVMSSASHWGKFHVGANMCFSINAGLAESTGCIIDFGPSVRFDIAEKFFVNMPINAVCMVNYIDGGDSKTSWGAKIAPSIHAFVSRKVGLFVGPQVTFPFTSNAKTSVGLQAGISYSY